MLKRLLTPFGLALLVAVAVCVALNGQSNRPPQTTKYATVRFFDVATGFAVDPDDVTVDMQHLQKQNSGRFQAERTFRIDVGRHKLTVKRRGYKDLVAEITIAAAEEPPLKVFLSPDQLPIELRDSAMSKLPRPDATAVIGFVSDEITGGPLPDVIVHGTTRGGSSTTNERGFFLLYLPTPATTDEPQLTDLIFERAGYTSEEHRHVRLDAGDVLTYRIALAPGSGTRVIDEDKSRRHGGEFQQDGVGEVVENRISSGKASLVAQGAAADPDADLSIPATIRVGTLGGVVVYPFDEYCKHVLPNEWVAGWNDDSLKAGAVAVRTYALYFIHNPLTRTYDICDSTACQVFSPTSSTSMYTDNAVENTLGALLIDTNGNVPKSEYAAETNNWGCGQGYSGQPPYYPCFSDSVCAFAPPYGHGRGMCQNGSHRWASALVFDHMGDQGLPVDRSSGQPKQTWHWILNQYYGPNGYRVYPTTVPVPPENLTTLVR